MVADSTFSSRPSGDSDNSSRAAVVVLLVVLFLLLGLGAYGVLRLWGGLGDARDEIDDQNKEISQLRDDLDEFADVDVLGAKEEGEGDEEESDETEDGEEAGEAAVNNYYTYPTYVTNQYLDPTGDLVPPANLAYDLGSPAFRWDDVYAGDFWGDNFYGGAFYGDFNGNLVGDVTGDLNGCVYVGSGDSYYCTNAYVAGVFEVDGVATFNDDIDVHADIIDSTGVVRVNDILWVTGSIWGDQDLDLWGNIWNSSSNNNGHVRIDDRLLVPYSIGSGDSDPLYLSDNQGLVVETYNGGSGTTLLSVDGVGNTYVAGYLNVAGNTYLDGDLDVDGVAEFDGLVVANDMVYLQSGLDVDGPAEFDGPLSLNGPVYLQDSLDVDGVAQFDNDVYMEANLDVDGMAEFDGPIVANSMVYLQSGLDVDGVAEFDSIALFNGPVYMQGSLDVDGMAEFDGVVVANDMVYLQSGLDVDGPAEFDGPLSMGGPVYLQDSLDVDGVAQFDNDVYMEANLDVDGMAEFDGPVVANDMVYLQSGLDVDGLAQFDGDVYLGDAAGDTISANGRFDTNLMPAASGAYTMGDWTNRWLDANFTGVVRVGVGGDQAVLRRGSLWRQNGDFQLYNTGSGNITVSSVDNINLNPGIRVVSNGDVIPGWGGGVPAYDLGKSWRPWNNVYAMNFYGVFNGDVTGDTYGTHNGDSYGTHYGNVEGNVTGNLTGNVTGNVTGNLTGNVSGCVSTTGGSTYCDDADVAGSLTVGGGYGDIDGGVSVDDQGSVSMDGDLQVDGELNVDSDSYINAQLTVNDLVVNGTADIFRVDSHLIPNADLTYDLGSPAFRWSTVYSNDGSFDGNVTVVGSLLVGAGSMNVVNEITNQGVLLGTLSSSVGTLQTNVSNLQTAVAGLTTSVTGLISRHQVFGGSVGCMPLSPTSSTCNLAGVIPAGATSVTVSPVGLFNYRAVVNPGMGTVTVFNGAADPNCTQIYWTAVVP